MTMMSGTAIAQIISLLAIPVLSRIFTPEEFGVFAIFMSLNAVISSISCGRYELAIMLPKKEHNAYTLALISFRFLIIISILSFITIFIFNDSLIRFFELNKYKYILFLLPISVFLTGLYKILYNWHGRRKNFKKISVSNVTKSGTSVAGKIGFGMLSLKSFGLIIGELAGQFFSAVYLLFKAKRLKVYFKHKHKKGEISTKMKEYKNFPFFSMPMALLNSVSVDILVYVLSIISNASTVGLYNQAVRVINFPLSFLTNSFTSVFFQKLTETKKKNELYLYSYLSSVLIACLVLFPIFFWGVELFSFVLGKEWAFSGEIAKVLLPLVIFGFATRNVSVVYSYLKLQQITLLWQALYLLAALFIFFGFKESELLTILFYYSVFGAFMYIVLGIYGYFLLRKHK